MFYYIINVSLVQRS